MSTTGGRELCIQLNRHISQRCQQAPHESERRSVGHRYHNVNNFVVAGAIATPVTSSDATQTGSYLNAQTPDNVLPPTYPNRHLQP